MSGKYSKGEYMSVPSPKGDLKVVLPVTPKRLTAFLPLEYSQVFRAKIVIDRPGCKLHQQVYFPKYRGHFELIEYIEALHEVSRCNCGVTWPYFDVFPYTDGEGLIIK